MIGVLGGAPDLVRWWVAAAPERFIPALDVRFDRATGEAFAPVPPGARRQPLSLGRIRELHRSGALQVMPRSTSR